MTEPLRVLSLGGGTQSCALALMSAAGDVDHLDAVVFADTQGELPETYAYLDYLRPQLANAAIPFHVVTAGNLETALLADRPTSSNPTPPAYVKKPDGTRGRIGQYRCSYDYKRRVLNRAVKRLAGGRGAWKRADVEQWIGFSADEVGRTRRADECRCAHKAARHGPACDRCACERFDPWQTNRWPLIEMGYRRADTLRWFADHGHPTPVRSACWFCPNSTNARWQAVRDNHPDLFDRACTIDDTIRDGGGFNRRGRQQLAGELYLHGTLTPLRDADLRTRHQVAADAGQLELFAESDLGAECQAGVCFT